MHLIGWLLVAGGLGVFVWVCFWDTAASGQSAAFVDSAELDLYREQSAEYCRTAVGFPCDNPRGCGGAFCLRVHHDGQ